MKLLFKIAMAVSLIPTLTAVSYAENMSASSLRQSQKAVEGDDGYLHAKSNDPEVVKAVNTINAKRRQNYEQIASKTKQSVDVVARQAAQQLKQK